MTSRRTFIVGTHGSRLALRQTELLVQELRRVHGTFRFEIREVKTEGDRRKTVSLAQIGGQGVFVKELEAALSRGDIDLAVHSLKDVPSDLATGLVLAAFPARADPRDALVSHSGTLATLPAGARVGTGSQRRAVQLRKLRPDIEPADIRGNVDTRVRKVDEGDIDAAVLAAAGLWRLGLLERAAQVFSTEEMVPAVGQGALAVETRNDDEELIDLLSGIDDQATRVAGVAERAFMRRLGGGCRLPFGALGTVAGDKVRVRGFIANEAGNESFSGEASASIAEPEQAGLQLAEDLLAQGAALFIEAASSI